MRASNISVQEINLISLQVKVLQKTVDATRMLTNVPATKPPEYHISDGVNLVPINALADIQKPWKRYVIIGAGKTGLDAIFHLIENNVDPKKIVWIAPNDSWYWNRDQFSDLKNFPFNISEIFGSYINAEDVNDAYKKSEDVKTYLRIDKNIWPTKMRAATVSTHELEKIKCVGEIVRHGRIDRIEKDSINFQLGQTIPTDTDTLHIDCSASSTNFPPVNNDKIFNGNNITLILVQVPQPCTSGAIIAALELK